MKRAILIAEKPDLMRQIQEVYKKHEKELPYDMSFISQRGHLLTLMLPSELDEEQKKWKWENLPFHPDEYGGWQYKPIKEKKTGRFLTSEERLVNIKKEVSSGRYDFIINAGDPDQEGELLIRIVLGYIGNTLPVKRFWTNDLTEGHILAALKDLKDDDHDPMLTNLLSAAYARQHSDYLYGMNISEAASLKMNGRVACGRVKTPLLAIVCKREDEIRDYREKTVYSIGSDYNEGFSGKLAKDGKQVWYETKKEAEDLISRLPLSGKVTSFSEKEIKTYAPKLFKLATLQIEAGKLGYSDKTTLDTIQGLYEKKYLSYPRTDCEYLSSSEDFKGILAALRRGFSFDIDEGQINAVRKNPKWINDKALEKSGHSALRPTTSVPDLASLTKAERDIYTLIANRFIAMFYPPMVQKERKIIADISGNEFTSSGKTVIQKGFTEFLGNTPADSVIPEKKKGDILTVNDLEVLEKKSEKPKRFTGPELIAVCEKPRRYSELKKDFKIGTPATRSGIIRQLIDKDGYIEEIKEGKKTVLKPTDTGERIIRNLGDLSICKVDMTGQWEEKLQSVRDGEMAGKDLEAELYSDVIKMIGDIRDKENAESLKTSAYTCPICKKGMKETAKAVSCECGLIIWKEVCGKKLTKTQIKNILEKGDSGLVKGFTSKKGSKFDAHIALEEKKTAFRFS